MMQHSTRSRRAGWLRAGVFGALALISSTLGVSVAVRAERVQLELVLALDASLSVSDEEFALQLHGLAEAFRNEAVVAAIRAAGDHGIAVLLLQWSDRAEQTVAVDWTAVRDAVGARALAEKIGQAPRAHSGAGTAIGRALETAIPLFRMNGFEGDRKVIDLSGDGVDNRGPLPDKIRRIAVAAGITVNALAILNENRFLDRYYERNVIGGTGAFVMTAVDYRDFAVAIVRKLIREISDQPLAERSPDIGHGLAAASLPNSEP
ncbi:MAG: DUF1194 domain-containing protein [Rhodospirillales bacterium]|nr:DUF1194 domain-containing protein [Rhodospirillales bacterium]